MKRIIQIFIACIPLIVSFNTYDPSLSIRFLILSIITSVMVLHYMLAKKQLYKEIIQHPFMIFYTCIITCYLISTAYYGFQSESIAITIKLILFYLFGILITHHIKEYGYKHLLNSFLFFSIALSIIYLFQIITNYDNIMNISKEWDRNYEFDKISATMGHKNLLSSIQFLILPFLVYIFLTREKIHKILSVLAVLLILLILFQTQTRAVLFSIFIFFISYLLININIINKKRILIILISLSSLLAVGFITMKVTKRYDAFVGEINRTLDFKSSSRYKLYDNSLQLIKDHPIIGVGPGNWKIDIWQYGLYAGTWGTSFAQRPHNDFLWVFAEGGLFAGISYILLFIILLRDSYILHRDRNDKKDPLYGILFSAIIAYAFISLVDFPLERIAHNIVFFIIAAIIISARVNINNKLPKWSLVILLIVSFFIVHIGIIRYNGEVHARNAIDLKSKGKWAHVIKAIDKGYHPLYYEMENTSTPLLWYRGVAYFSQKKYNLAFKDFQASYELNPYHVHVLNNLATSYEIKGKSKSAKKYYREVFKVNPTFKESRINLSAILFNEKKYEEAMDVILQSNVKPYWQREKNNDKYDHYLKTIVRAWISKVYNQSNELEKKYLKQWNDSFEKPKGGAVKSKKIFNIKEKENINYLQALLKYKQTINN